MEEQPNFVSHVFNFEKDSRNEMANIVQYTVLGIILISLLNKLIEKYMPEPDAKKGSISLFVEVSIQCIILFIGILFIHRLITYLPTLSGVKYSEQNVIAIILPTLIVLLSVNDLGKKMKYLIDSLMSSEPPVKVKHTQPFSSTSTAPLLPTRSSTSNPITQEPDFSPSFSSPTAPTTAAVPMNEPMPSNFGGLGNNMF